MKILADENVARDLVAWLRNSGHDVLFAAEQQAGSTDLHWAQVAEQERRIVLTSDKDFGEIVFRDSGKCHGIVLMRLDDLSLTEILSRMQGAWSVVEANPDGMFIVITEHKIRVRPLPSR